VEYGDFQCPHCRAAHPHVKMLIKHFGDKIGFVFRHFPLSEIHPMALGAALTAEAADNKGKFWEMYDAIFDQQELLEEGLPGLQLIIRSVGLNPGETEKEWTDKGITAKVNDDFESGILSGVNGTPSFFINGTKYNGAYDFSSMEKAIQKI